MSDLDFDELDKAVNSLMKDVPKATPPKDDDVNVLNLDSSGTSPTQSAPMQQQPAAAVAKPTLQQRTAIASEPARSSTPPLAARRGGRFMDVVHASSDMKVTSKPSMPTSRQGVTIAPAAPVETTPNAGPVIDIITAPVPPTELAQPVDQPSAAASDWPDPLEMKHDLEPSTIAAPEEKAQPETKTTAPVEKPATDDLLTSDDLQEQEPQPLVSPFLSGTKVEKRPLGGSKTDPESEPGRSPVLGVLAGDIDNDLTDRVNAQLPVKDAEPEAQMPREYHEDLIAIETDGGTAAAASTVPDVTEEPPTQSEKPAPVAKPKLIHADTPQTSTGPTSIAQQYKEEPSTSDQHTGSIYDTAAYHTPVTHPAKKSLGWLWALWIILLVALGGGGAAALYFFNIL